MPFTCALCHTADFPRSKRKRALCEVCFDGLVARGLAWCTVGHRVKAEDMATRKSRCRACENAATRARYDSARTRERMKQYRATHKDEARAYAERPDVRERRRAARRRYNQTHRARNAATERQRYARNPARALELKRQWHARNPEYRKEYGRRYYRQKKLRAFRGER